MKKQLLIIALCVLVAAMLTACIQIHTHDFGKWETEKKATCEKPGLKVRECDCGKEESKEIPELDHAYQVKEEKAPSCEEEGALVYTCEECGDSYTEAVPCKNYTATELYDMYLHSVGEVITYNRSGQEQGLGSCFVYSEDGKLITNYHVIEGAYSAKVTFGETTYDIQKVLAYDKKIDLAVLQISASGLKPVTLCDLGHKVGEVVYAFGNSQGLTSTFSDGMITFSNRESEGVHYVQHDAPISSGNSGGPLINVYGEVIGINTMTVVDSQNLNFAICIAELENLNYSTPLTMTQFFDAEGNAYKRMAEYTAENGDYSDGSYFLVVDAFYSSDRSTEYLRFVSYYPDDGDLLLGICANEDNFVYIVLDEDLSGRYMWTYFDDAGYEMSGTVDAATYSDDSLLSYTDHNIRSSVMRDSVHNLASVMMGAICESITESFAEIGVTAADLGFVNFR